LIFFI